MTSSGLNVHEAGDGPALLLLHAFPCDGSMWAPQMEAAARSGWRVLAPDLPGFGVSPLPDAAPDLDVVVDAILDVLDERDIDRAVVAGSSMGGYLAMGLLRHRPSLVGALVLCGTKANADGEGARANREVLAQRVLADPGETAAILQTSVLPNLLGATSHRDRPSAVGLVRRWIAVADADTVAWYQRAMARRPDSLSDLADADVPTLVVWGEEDAMSGRAEQDAMVTAAADSRLQVVAGAGHLVTLEEPEVVNDALLSFLETIAGPRHA
jgi:pimeloyl-ACP methyl ester carboxylesterase